MNYMEMMDAVNDAQGVVMRGRTAVRRIGGLVSRDLRSCDSWDLKLMKRTLKDFNSKTGKWKEDE